MPSLLKAKGLSTYHNELQLSEGSLLTADNVVIDRNDVVKPRRGFNTYNSCEFISTIDQIFQYKDSLLLHIDGKLYYDCNCNLGNFTAFDGTYLPIDCLRIKGTKTNGNFYFTTIDGVKKISGTYICCTHNFTTDPLFILNAGGPKSLDIQSVLQYNTGGFLPPLSKVAYRLVWGTRDNNENLILGSPSARLVVTNADYPKQIKQTTKITINCVCCVPSCLDSGDYFLIDEGNGTQYFVWYDETPCSTTLTPTNVDTIGKIGIRVNINNTDNSATVLNKTAAKISSCTNFSLEFCCCCSSTFSIISPVVGELLTTIDGASPTNFTFITTVTGYSAPGKSSDVTIISSIPSCIKSTCYFYQLYRTKTTTTTTSCSLIELEPGDEMNLVFEKTLLQNDRDNGYISIDDNICDSFYNSGVALYTNASTGCGILQANEKPPLAKDITTFRNHTFYANTQTIHKKQINFLTVCDFLVNCSKIIVANCCDKREYTFVGTKNKGEITTVADTKDSYFFNCEDFTFNNDPCVCSRNKINGTFPGLIDGLSVQFNAEQIDSFSLLNGTILYYPCNMLAITPGSTFQGQGNVGRFTVDNGKIVSVPSACICVTNNVFHVSGHRFYQDQRVGICNTGITTCPTSKFYDMVDLFTRDIGKHIPLRTIPCAITFNSPNQIIRNDCGSWIDCGFNLPGKIKITCSRCALNDGCYIISSLTASTITISTCVITASPTNYEAKISQIGHFKLYSNQTCCGSINIICVPSCMIFTISPKLTTFPKEPISICVPCNYIIVCCNICEYVSYVKVQITYCCPNCKIITSPLGLLDCGSKVFVRNYTGALVPCSWAFQVSRTMDSCIINIVCAPSGLKWKIQTIDNCGLPRPFSVNTDYYAFQQCMTTFVQLARNRSEALAGTEIIMIYACDYNGMGKATFTPSGDIPEGLCSERGYFLRSIPCTCCMCVQIYNTAKGAICGISDCLIKFCFGNSPARILMDSHSLNGKYILVNSASNKRKYVFWFENLCCSITPIFSDTENKLDIQVSVPKSATSYDVAASLKESFERNTNCDFTIEYKKDCNCLCLLCTLVICWTESGCSAEFKNGIYSPGFTLTTLNYGIGEKINDGNGPIIITTPICCIATCPCNLFTYPCHGYTTGVRGQWTSTGTLPTGINSKTDYFIINVSTSTFKMASSRENAINCTPITISCEGCGIHTFTPSGGDFILSDVLSPTQAIDETAKSLIRIINSDACGIVDAFYLSGECDLPGIILFQAKSLSSPEFVLGTDKGVSTCSCIICIDKNFNPILDQSHCITDFTICGSSTIVDSASHGFKTNDVVYIFNTLTNLDGKKVISAVPCINKFKIDTIACCVSCITGKVFYYGQYSNNEKKPNRLYFSKESQPEAVPLVNFLDVGTRDEGIDRIIALRDNLFVLKKDGTFILTGTTSSDFIVKLLDNSANIIARDSAAILNNQIFMLTTQGVTRVTDSGVCIISRSIEDKILDVIGPNFNTESLTFGLGYESDRSYLLWLPTNEVDTVATQVYRYNTFNNSWVRWTVCSTSGIINNRDDKIYLGAGNNNNLLKERKNNNRTDIADLSFDLNLIYQSTQDCLIQLESISCIEVGDSLVQTQYVTVVKFNRLLRKLTLDINLNCTYDSCLLTNGACIALELSNLVTKLNNDINQSIVTCNIQINPCNYIVYCCHPFLDGERLVINSSCTSPVTSPTGLLDCCDIVYVTQTTNNSFKLSLTPLGCPIVITCGGTGCHTFTSKFSIPVGTTFSEINIDYNTLISELNYSSGTYFTDYTPITDSTDFETLITDINISSGNIYINNNMNFIIGPVTIYKGIESIIEWAPQHFGEPSITKQIKEGTIIFNGNNFYSAELYYSTDTSKDFEGQLFYGRGSGVFGGFEGGDSNWGGEGTDSPYRTLIPEKKQRCRYITPKFIHKNAREDFSILGISLEPRALSSRGYRKI